MLSVIIPTRDSERAVVATLSPLVSGATAGLITEVILADGGSQDDTAAVADVAGCRFMAVDGSLAVRFKAAAVAARAPWLLFLRPGTVLDAAWTDEVGRFVQQGSPDRRAAVFRRGRPSEPVLREMLSLVAAAFGRPPHLAQGLLISKQFYAALGSHSERVADPETDLIRRIGRSRIVRLSTSAFTEILD